MEKSRYGRSLNHLLSKQTKSQNLQEQNQIIRITTKNKTMALSINISINTKICITSYKIHCIRGIWGFQNRLNNRVFSRLKARASKGVFKKENYQKMQIYIFPPLFSNIINNFKFQFFFFNFSGPHAPIIYVNIQPRNDISRGWDEPIILPSSKMLDYNLNIRKCFKAT